VILLIVRTTITLIDPIILDSVSIQLLVQGFGSSIIIAVVTFVAIRQKKITLSGKANPKILLIETLVFLLLIVASVDMALL